MPLEQIYLTIVFVTAIIIPIITTASLYTGLLNKVNYARRSIMDMGSSKVVSKDTGPRGIRLRRSIWLFIIALVIAWCPLLLYKLIKYFKLDLGPKVCLNFGRVASLLPLSRKGEYM